MQLLEDVTYHAGGFEPFRIFLARGVKYRAEFSEPNVIMQMRSYEGKSVPFARLIGDGPDVSGATTYEIVPNSDGVIEFRAVDAIPGTATRFRLWEVKEPVEEVAGESHAPPVEFGVLLRAGEHPAYVTDSFTYAHSGKVAEGCLAIRGGGGILARLGGCIVGFSHLTGGNRYVLDFAFTEPRFRIIGPAIHAGLTPSAGAMVRLSSFVGTSQTGPQTPPLSARVTAGFGLYGALDQRLRKRSGFRVEVQVLLDGIGAATDTALAPTTPRPGSAHAVSVRLGGGLFF